jgi:hypothetical protein
MAEKYCYDMYFCKCFEEDKVRTREEKTMVKLDFILKKILSQTSFFDIYIYIYIYIYKNTLNFL